MREREPERESASRQTSCRTQERVASWSEGEVVGVWGEVGRPVGSPAGERDGLRELLPPNPPALGGFSTATGSQLADSSSDPSFRRPPPSFARPRSRARQQPSDVVRAPLLPRPSLRPGADPSARRAGRPPQPPRPPLRAPSPVNSRPLPPTGRLACSSALKSPSTSSPGFSIPRYVSVPLSSSQLPIESSPSPRPVVPDRPLASASPSLPSAAHTFSPPSSQPPTHTNTPSHCMAAKSLPAASAGTPKKPTGASTAASRASSPAPSQASTPMYDPTGASSSSASRLRLRCEKP